MSSQYEVDWPKEKSGRVLVATMIISWTKETIISEMVECWPWSGRSKGSLSPPSTYAEVYIKRNAVAAS